MSWYWWVGAAAGVVAGYLGYRARVWWTKLERVDQIVGGFNAKHEVLKQDVRRLEVWRKRTEENERLVALAPRLKKLGLAAEVARSSILEAYWPFCEAEKFGGIDVWKDRNPRLFLRSFPSVDALRPWLCALEEAKKADGRRRR